MRRLLATAGLVLAAGCSDTGPTGERALAILSGQDEVPPVVTSAAGSAAFTILADGTVEFSLTVQNITGVTAARLYQGQPGAIGTILLTLYANAPGTPPIASEVLAVGRITPAGIAPVPMNSLLTLLRTAGAYVNVHTTGRPNGEIRGQIVPS